MSKKNVISEMHGKCSMILIDREISAGWKNILAGAPRQGDRTKRFEMFCVINKNYIVNFGQIINY